MTKPSRPGLARQILQDMAALAGACLAMLGLLLLMWAMAPGVYQARIPSGEEVRR